MNDMTSLKWLGPITFSVVSLTYRKTRLLMFFFFDSLYISTLSSAMVAICLTLVMITGLIQKFRRGRWGIQCRANQLRDQKKGKMRA